MTRKTDFERKIAELFGPNEDDEPVRITYRRFPVASPSRKHRRRFRDLDWFEKGVYVLIVSILLAFSIAWGAVMAIWVDALIKAG